MRLSRYVAPCLAELWLFLSPSVGFYFLPIISSPAQSGHPLYWQRGYCFLLCEQEAPTHCGGFWKSRWRSPLWRRSMADWPLGKLAAPIFNFFHGSVVPPSTALDGKLPSMVIFCAVRIQMDWYASFPLWRKLGFVVCWYFLRLFWCFH